MSFYEVEANNARARTRVSHFAEFVKWLKNCIL